MPTLRRLLNDLSTRIFTDLGLDPKYAEVVPSQRPDLGQFQCNGALAAAKVLKRRPQEIAAAAIARFESEPWLRGLSVAGPGFINLSVTDDFLSAQANSVAADPRLGVPAPQTVRHFIVDYGGPNVAKALHVGHLRSAIIGECLKSVLRFAGHRVTGDVHLGDWGTQMGMLVLEVERRQPGLPYFDAAFTGPYPKASPVSIDDLGELYPAAAERSKTDPAAAEAARRATVDLQAGRPGYRALWQHFVDVSVADLARNFERLGVTFDLWLGESSVHERIAPMIERLKSAGFAVESDGALVVHVEEPADTSEVPPLILQKRDGASMYGTTDLATIDQRVRDFGADEIIYVVDKRQALHFQQVFRAARKSGIAGTAILDHAGFGTVNDQDGKPFKTRAGGVMRLEDLIAMGEAAALKRLDEAGLATEVTGDERMKIATQVGIGAIKFTDLQHQRASDYVFQLEKFTSFDGYTGPYLQYAAVRIRALLRKASERGFSPATILPATDLDRDLLLHLTRFPDAIELTIAQRAPSHLCEYVYDLCRFFSRFYESCHILSEADPARRGSALAVVQLTEVVTAQCLTLLGLEIPARL